ncbi:heavy-metal-associated domain-containing protein [Pedobacter sp. MC2016-14]|uniref:heavy-metal-associated domain-containing protein n=1 Tax=Pedobacter sp. MC2016-14 TaxID=2897327 RepID=UPI001E5F4739|nr:heavy metal-associated domain-containing protein [Pedobacter sp. MC2016-14]MCD0490244.1 heavy-metal-associated domain-containing protein [Pedobacter sp. MC2016-14]
METLKFKTNIKCAGCITTVTPYLDSLAGIESWNADVHDPNKILTITSSGQLEANQVIQILEKAGYKAEEI